MKAVALLERTAGLIGGIILFLIMLITFVDVIGRTFFNNPLLGAAELTELFMALMIFLLLPSVSLRQEHITVDLIDAFAGRWLNIIRNVLTGVLGAAFFGMMAWRLYVNAGRSMSYGDATNNLDIPVGPFIYIFAVMAALTAVVFAVLLFRMKTRTGSVEFEMALRSAKRED